MVFGKEKLILFTNFLLLLLFTALSRQLERDGHGTDSIFKIK